MPACCTSMFPSTDFPKTSMKMQNGCIAWSSMLILISSWNAVPSRVMVVNQSERESHVFSEIFGEKAGIGCKFDSLQVYPEGHLEPKLLLVTVRSERH